MNNGLKGLSLGRRAMDVIQISSVIEPEVVAGSAGGA